MSGPATPASGRAARRWERRRRDRRLVLVALAVAVVATLVVTVYFARRSTPPPLPSAGGQARTQQTLLVQLRGVGGDAVGVALLAHDRSAGTGAGLLVPPEVLVSAPGGSPQAYGSVLRTAGPAASRTALAGLLGVTVDGEWVLDAGTAAQLVEAVGGIRVTVDVLVPSAEGTSVLLQRGGQPVDGSRAVAFATYLAPGEQEPARLGRLQQLLDGVLAALPRSSAQVAGLLGTLGNGSTLQGTDVPALAGTLVGLAADERAKTLKVGSVPVGAEQPGALGPPLDAVASRQVVERLLGASVR